MWQRIQSLYLFIAICLNLSIYALTLAEVKMGESLSTFNLYGLTDGEGVALVSNIYLSILCTLSALIGLIVIFLFKKRQLQIKLGQLNLLVQLGFMAAIFFAIDAAISEAFAGQEAVVSYGIGALLSILPTVLIYLAIRAVKKDEALVRAADRIR